MARTHYIGMAGLCGYLPQFCASFDSRADAAESLTDMHEAPRRVLRELKRNGHADLDLHKHGNEYAEIVECDCDNPDCHND